MPKINNAQRAAFARLLTQQKDRVAQDWPAPLGVRKWDNFASAEDPAVIAAIRRHKVVSLQLDARKAEAAFEAAVNAAHSDLRDINESRHEQRAAALQSLNDAIRDVWAAQELDDAKALVSKFVKV